MTSIEAVVASVDALLLDFDGPVCDLFAGYPAKVTAAEARAAFSKRGVSLPIELRCTSGALVLLKWAQLHIPDIVPEIEAIQEMGELRGLNTAEPTPHCITAIVAAAQVGLKLAVVSNNSTNVIAQYLNRHGLDAYIAEIAGRKTGQANLMKPCPEPLVSAASAIGVQIGRCVMIGDAATDMEAANRAGARSIGYAARADSAALISAGANAVIYTMSTLATILEARKGGLANANY